MKENQNDMEFLVRLHKTFTDEENVCFVFEYLEGPDLSHVLLQQWTLFPDQQDTEGRRSWVSFYSAEILIALRTVHSKNIIYRDLKPENVMIDG